jgi:hypothetical protein
MFNIEHRPSTDDVLPALQDRLSQVSVQMILKVRRVRVDHYVVAQVSWSPDIGGKGPSGK